jgi:predicted transcriptional regulator
MNSIHVNFHKVPNKIFDIGLSKNELGVLSYLLSLTNNPTIHPSKTMIASKIKLSKRTVDKAITSLVKKGFIEYNRGFIKDTKRVCNQYRIRVEYFAPECIEKSPNQLARETRNVPECSEIIMELIEELGK